MYWRLAHGHCPCAIMLLPYVLKEIWPLRVISSSKIGEKTETVALRGPENWQDTKTDLVLYHIKLPKMNPERHFCIQAPQINIAYANSQVSAVLCDAVRRGAFPFPPRSDRFATQPLRICRRAFLWIGGWIVIVRQYLKKAEN